MSVRRIVLLNNNKNKAENIVMIFKTGTYNYFLCLASSNIPMLANGKMKCILNYISGHIVNLNDTTVLPIKRIWTSVRMVHWQS